MSTFIGDLETTRSAAHVRITKLASGPEHMTVADVDALLYLSGHTRQDLLRALRVPALSPGRQGSFRALLNEEPGSGNAGLVVTSPPPAWPGFRQVTVKAITRESDSAISVRLEDPAGTPLPAARPGQYITLRVQPNKGQRALLRNYSLSGPPGAAYYRVTVKREKGGAASGYLHTRLAVGDQLDIAAPRGTFILDQTDVPVLLISAGIGATPVLAMLQALAQERSDREIWCLHGARNGREHPFAAEARALLSSLPNARIPVWAHSLHGRNQRGSGRLGVRCLPHPHRTVRAGSERDARDRSDAGAGAPPTRRPARKRPDDRVRPQRPHDPMEQRLRHPARTRRVLRRTRPLVMPHRRLPDLRDDAHRRGCRLQPRPG
jgi:ferredoxin-NADP reductase